MMFIYSTQSTNISNVNEDNSSLTISSHTMLTTQYNEEVFHTGINTRLIKIEIFPRDRPENCKKVPLIETLFVVSINS